MTRDALIEAQDYQTKYANLKRREASYNIGNMVMLRTDHLHPDTLAQQPAKKLRARRIGPYKIMEKISEVNYKLQLPHNIRVHPVFHISQLVDYHENPFPERTVPPPPPIRINDHEEFEIEEVLDHKVRKYPKIVKRFFLIKWKGYPTHDATWEKEEALKNARKALQDYMETLTPQQRKELQL